jgi:hypothetical protein
LRPLTELKKHVHIASISITQFLAALVQNRLWQLPGISFNMALVNVSKESCHPSGTVQ